VAICEGETAGLAANGANTYQWSTGAETPAIFVAPLSSTSYTVTGTNSGCIGSAVALVKVNSKPAATISPSVSITMGSNTSLVAGGGVSYNWTPSAGLSCNDCPDPVAGPQIKTDYCVEVTSSEGCRNIACTTVAVENKEIKCGNVFVPTAFSPNNDGVNDVACVFGSCITKMRFVIFDRWGEKVFESSSVKETWDGNFRGEPMNTAVFVYYLKATLANGEEVSQKGNITLVR